MTFKERFYEEIIIVLFSLGWIHPSELTKSLERELRIDSNYSEFYFWRQNLTLTTEPDWKIGENLIICDKTVHFSNLLFHYVLFWGPLMYYCIYFFYYKCDCKEEILELTYRSIFLRMSPHVKQLLWKQIF